MALLEADVNFRVVREFVGKVRERAQGAGDAVEDAGAFALVYSGGYRKGAQGFVV